MNKPLRVLLAFDMPYAVARDHDYTEDFKDRENFETEDDVYQALVENGCGVRRLGLFDDVRLLLDTVAEFKPDVIFNLIEMFDGTTSWDKNMTALIELLDVPYTGAMSGTQFLCNDKGLCKKILRFHRVRTPRFHTYYRGHKVWLPKTLKLPCVIKPLTEEASRGISQASIVEDEGKLVERASFIHDSIGADAIVEQFIEGRELYVGVIGNKHIKVLPIWELVFENLPPGNAAIATARAKHNPEYQEKWGIYQQPAEGLSPTLIAHIVKTSKRIYRTLQIDGYARIDYRLSPTGELYFLEANPNPEIAEREEFASAAQSTGIPYPKLLQKILNLGLQRGR